MRERMERFVLLPFSAGCISESSVAVAVQQPRKSKDPPPSTGSNNKEDELEECEDESLSGESNRSSFRSSSLRKPNMSTGIHRLVKGFKNFSQYFVYKEEMVQLEIDMEIGGPTDVKHVAHIGWDGSATTGDFINSWESLISPDSLPAPPPVSWRPSFEFAVDHAPLVNGSSS